MASDPEVLCLDPKRITPPSLFGRPSVGSYKRAIAQAIRDIKARHRLSNERLAELVGCSEQTIANAESDHPENALNAVTLLNLAYAFGEDAIEPVRQLYLCKPAEPPSILSEIEAARQALNAAEKRILERGV